MGNREELNEVLEQLENEEEQNIYDDSQTRRRLTNADYLDIFSYINLVLFIIGALYVIINSFSDEINFTGIIIGVICLATGITLFLLLKTIVDIYRKIEN